MRTHGTLTRWNDDRGFGFVTPAKGPPDVFVHISAFPREGGRPRLNELISFEVEPGKDGKPRAIRVMRTAQKAASHPATRSVRQQESARSRSRAGSVVLTLIVVAGVGFFGWSRWHRESAPVRVPPASAGQFVERVETPAAVQTQPEPAPALLPQPVAAPSPRFSCDGRTMCSQMSSCAEAKYFLQNCPNTKMDGDGDRVPCEEQWCGH